jgi:hypothetical protein
MISKRLRSRLKFVEGTPLQNRVRAKSFSRRETGGADSSPESSPNDKFETFFDYEEELSGLKSSSEQFANMKKDLEEESNFVQMEYVDSKDNNENDNITDHGYVVMQDVMPIIMESEKPLISDTPTDMPGKDANTKDNKEDKLKKFEFIRCEFIKKDDARCKRQAPKGSTICSVHKKFIEKRGR